MKKTKFWGLPLPSRAAVACVVGLIAAAGCAVDSHEEEEVMRQNERPGSGAANDTSKSEDRELFGVIPAATLKKRLTGADLDTNHRWAVAGTDLGIPYVLENGSIGYLFGDTFNTPDPFGPPLPNDWRSPVMLRSNVHPGDPGGIVFDSAAKVRGNGRTPDLFFNAKDQSKKPRAEFSVIPNDGISFPETGRQVVSFMSIHDWDQNGEANWRTNYASLAYSDNGNDFTRVPYLGWENSPDNKDPFQMWTMQRDGDFVYVFSVRAGRQSGPMMLRRVHWRNMFDKGAYECWGRQGANWAWGHHACTPILEGRFGEPSVRRLKNGTWAMAYLNVNAGAIVTRTAPRPDAPWTPENPQVTQLQEQNLYGGFIHPWSEEGPNKLHLIVSKWIVHQPVYHVSQWVGTL
ncbi:MAG TPA: DUF4185 domain-containing protein [Labilithrix sp.]|nr:DUF4185 domain-containing protein [Labilithrix sp.]